VVARARQASRLRTIAAWALLTTGVGLALRAVEQLPYAGSVAGRIVTSILDGAWAIASFFVVPALVLDDVGVRESLRSSVATIRARWGEAATGSIAIGGAGLLVTMPILIAGVVGFETRDAHPVAGYGLLSVAVALGVVTIVIQQTVSEAFRVAVFRYARGGTTAGPFSESHVAEAFRPRTRRRLFG
jgi:hypothetical protein